MYETERKQALRWRAKEQSGQRMTKDHRPWPLTIRTGLRVQLCHCSSPRKRTWRAGIIWHQLAVLKGPNSGELKTKVLDGKGKRNLEMSDCLMEFWTF